MVAKQLLSVRSRVGILHNLGEEVLLLLSNKSLWVHSDGPHLGHICSLPSKAASVARGTPSADWFRLLIAYRCGKGARCWLIGLGQPGPAVN